MEVNGGEVGLQLNNKPIDFEVRRVLEMAKSYSLPWNILVHKIVQCIPSVARVVLNIPAGCGKFLLNKTC